MPLTRMKQFIYLDHLLTTDLNDDANIERERREMYIRENMLGRRFSKCSHQVKIMLFRAYYTSLYTSNLWARYTQKAYIALRVQHNNASGCCWGCPASVAHQECFPRPGGCESDVHPCSTKCELA